MNKVIVVFIAVSVLVLTGCTSTPSVSLNSHYRLAKDKAFLVVQNTSDHSVVITGLTSEVAYGRLSKGGPDFHVLKIGNKELVDFRRDSFMVTAAAPVELSSGKKREFEILGYRPIEDDQTLAIRTTLKSKGLTLETGLELNGSLLRELKRRWLHLTPIRNSGVSTKDLSEILGFVGRKSKYDVLGISVRGRKIWIHVGEVRGPLNANGSVLVFEKQADRWLLVEEWDWAS